MSDYAWVTLATNDSYSLGALVLAHSLRQVGTNYQLACMVTPGLSDVMREQLSTIFDVVFEVNILDSRDEANLLLLQRPELGITFTKMHCWRLTQFKKCVFLDADTLVLQNCDELFDREEFSAAPDVGWPDCFNSGVFVYKPSNDTYNDIVKFAIEHGSFDGGDQGLLNLYFSSWAYKDISKHLPFIYNMCSTACYSYLPAFKQFGEGVKIVHFIGPAKPWLQYFDSETFQVKVSSGFEHLQRIFQHWWDIFCSHVHSKLSGNMCGLAGALAQMTLGQRRSASQDALEDHLRRQGWEVGNIDYLGRDCFDNIWKKICETLQAPSPTPTEAAISSPAAEKSKPVQVTATVSPSSQPAAADKSKPSIIKKESKVEVVEKQNLPLISKPDMPVVVKSDMPVAIKPPMPVAVKPDMPLVVKPEMPIVPKPDLPATEKSAAKMSKKSKPEEFKLADPSTPIALKSPKSDIQSSFTITTTKASPSEKPSASIAKASLSEAEKPSQTKSTDGEKPAKKSTQMASKKMAHTPVAEKTTTGKLETAKTVPAGTSIPSTAASQESGPQVAPPSKRAANIAQERKKPIKKK